MISGSGAQMQGTSYLPGYFHVVDQNVGVNGSLWQLLSNGPACKISRFYNVLPEPSGPDSLLVFNKEILRQTMLKHEAIFRNQVHELHRLYGRQRELMIEISRNNLKMQASQSKLFPSEMQCNIPQKTLQMPFPLLDSKPTAQGGEYSQMPSNSDSLKSTQAGSRIDLKENAFEVNGVSPCKSHYSGKRVLDLELPADRYIDSEDEEGLEDRTTAQAPQVQYGPSETTSRSPSKSTLKLHEESSSNGSSNYSKTTFLFDLNEPIQLDESETPIPANFIGSSTEIMPQGHDSFQKSKSEPPLRNEESICHVMEGKGNEGSSLIAAHQDSSAQGSPLLCGDGISFASEVTKKGNEIFDDNNQSMLSSCISNSCSPGLISKEAKTEASTSVSSKKTSLHNFKEIPFAVQALPCFNSPKLLSKASRSSTPNSGIKRKYYNLERNPACSSSLGSISCCLTGNSDNEHAAEESTLSECIKDSHHAKSSEDVELDVRTLSCFLKTVISREKHGRTDGASSSKDSKGEFNKPTEPDYDGVDLDAPISPENEEHPRPRGVFEGNQIEQKSRETNEDSDRIAAEAIVSISSSRIQHCLKNDKSGAVEVSNDCLSWFAGLVSSFTGDQDIEFERLLKDASINDHNLLASGENEHDQGMLLKLRGIKVEDDDESPETSNQKSKTIAGIMSPSHQEGDGRPRKRRQKKGFVSGLPCITSSLPSADVTKNIQQTQQQPIKGKRNVGQKGCSRRIRKSKMASCHDNDKGRTVCSLLKQHTCENELIFTLGSYLGWGRKHRRQKRRQARASYCFHFELNYGFLVNSSYRTS